MLYQLAFYSGEIDTFNLGTAEGRSQNDILNIAKKWFPQLKVEYMEARNIDVAKNILDNRKIKEIYHRKITTLSEGMEKYYQYLLK